MRKFKDLLKSKSKDKVETISAEAGVKTSEIDDFESEKSGDFDWFSERYQRLLIQRNFSIVLIIISVLAVAASSISLAVVSRTKSIEPFVVQIDKSTGMIGVHDNDTSKAYSDNDLVRDYFVQKYLEARELYDPQNYAYFYYKVIRLMSNEYVYRTFSRSLYSTDNSNPKNLYARNISSKLRIISITPIKQGSKTLHIRFVVEAQMPEGGTTTRYRVVFLDYDYYNVELTEEMRYINPLGFVVTSYRVTDEAKENN